MSGEHIKLKQQEERVDDLGGKLREGLCYHSSSNM
jgi:hypothetical protein